MLYFSLKRYGGGHDINMLLLLRPISKTTIQHTDMSECFLLRVVLIPKLNIYSMNLLITGWHDTDTTTQKHKQLELYTGLVFLVGIGWYFAIILPTDTNGKLSWSISVLQIWREPLFPSKRGTYAPFLNDFLGFFQKNSPVKSSPKSSCQLKKVS